MQRSMIDGVGTKYKDDSMTGLEAIQIERGGLSMGRKGLIVGGMGNLS